MRDSRQRYMDLGVVHYASFPSIIGGTGPIIETMRKILLDDFFTAIEITWIKDQGVLRQVADILSYANMQVVFSAGPPYAFRGINLSALDGEVRKRSVAEAKGLIDDAYTVGARVHLVTTGPDTAPSDRAQAKDLLVDSLSDLCDYAQAQATDYLLTLSLEPVDRLVHRKGLVGPIQEAVEITKRVIERGGFLGLTLDQSHLAQLGISPDDAIATAGDSLLHVHLANCLLSDPSSPIYGDEHPRFGVSGSEHTVAEAATFFATLQRYGFFEREFPYGDRPIISVEVKPQESEDPELVLAATKRALVDAWARIR